MVAPVVATGLVKGAFSLLSGLFGSNSKKKALARQNWYNHPTQVRQRAEEAGFNPLAFIGPGVGQQTGTSYAPIMGQSIADAGAAYADGKQAEKQLEMQRAELEMENERLDALVKATKLTENVGGIYNHARQNQNNININGGTSDDNIVDNNNDNVATQENIHRYWGSSGAVSTDVAVGPDLDEMVTGAAIAFNNHRKRVGWLGVIAPPKSPLGLLRRDAPKIYSYMRGERTHPLKPVMSQPAYSKYMSNRNTSAY